MVEDEGLDEEGIIEGEEIEEEDEEEKLEIDIQNYFPESVITAGKVSEVLVSVKVKNFFKFS